MQLDGKTTLQGALTALTITLLGGGLARAEDGKNLQSSFLLYSETNRVTAAEGIIDLKLPLKGNRVFNGRLTIDGLTGASPNGATPSKYIQTFTSPSGNRAYTVNQGQLPLDDTFKDTRYSFNGSLNQPLDRLTTLIIGSNLSAEHDYYSVGVNVGLTRDFNRRNTTVSVSAAASHDINQPIGGIPTPMTSLATANGENEAGEDKAGFEDDGEGLGKDSRSKNVYDAVFGITQVLDRRMLLRLNYSVNHSSGYLNDPYKVISVVQNSQGADPGEQVDNLYESRPGVRTKQAVYSELKRYIGGHTIDISYRYFWDDWGITSHTIDFHYRLPIKKGHALQPHFRWYQQTAAKFYQTYLTDNNTLPDFASADYRLGPFHAITVGLQYFFPVGNGVHFSLGSEYYRQIGDLSPPESMGILSTVNLFPDMDAILVRAGINYDF